MNRRYCASTMFEHLVLLVALIAGPAYADQLIYVPLAQPCRLLDTRISTGGPGPLTAAHGAYLFGTSNADIESTEQHGSVTGCGIPVEAEAVSVNMNMLNATAPGNIATWSADSGAVVPNIGTGVYNPSAINPAAGQVLYNAGYTSIPLGSPAGANPGKFYLQVANGQIDATLNVVGYWLPFQYVAGTGLSLSGSTFSVAPTYRLPQSCAANQIAQWNGTAWACGNPGGNYTAGTGLALNGTMFSMAPTYQLPQSCAANQFPQWNGTIWGCGSPGASPPTGTVDQTLRYNAGNTLVSNNLLRALADGGLLAGGTLGTGSIPASGAGTRLMWHPAKAAFRAGNVDGSQWDDANVGLYSTAMGFNTGAGGSYSVAMGYQTAANGDYSTAMGRYSAANGVYSTALGTAIAGGSHSTAMGASTANGDYSTAMGSSTTASGSYSTAIGKNVDTNNMMGSFIYGDASSRSIVTNTANNQFVAAATGGVYFFTSCAATCTSGVGLAPGSGTWSTLSDRNAKTAMRPVDTGDVLKKVVAMPLNTWQYKSQESKYRHMGPMAQDFYAAFELGESDKGIDTVDADGVALAAIQGLHALLSEKDARIAALEAEVAVQKQELAEQKVRVAALSSLAGELADVKMEMAALRRSSPSMVTVASKQP